MEDIDKFIKRKLEKFHFEGSPRNSWRRMQKILQSQLRRGAIPAVLKPYAMVLMMPLLLACGYYLGTRKQAQDDSTNTIPLQKEDLDGGARQTEEVKQAIILQGSDGKLYSIEAQAWGDLGRHEFLCMTPYGNSSFIKRKEKHQASPIPISPFLNLHAVPPKTGEKNSQITSPPE